MSNWGLERALEGHGRLLIRADVGDRYVVEEMEKSGAVLGGEPSGPSHPRGPHEDRRRHAHRASHRRARRGVGPAAFGAAALRPHAASPQEREGPREDGPFEAIPRFAGGAAPSREHASPGTAGSSSGTPAPRRSPASWWRARTRPSSTRSRGISPTPSARASAHERGPALEPSEAELQAPARGRRPSSRRARRIAAGAARGRLRGSRRGRAHADREGAARGRSQAGPLLDLLFEKAIPASFNNAGPGYLAYIPGGGLPYAAVADLDLGRREPLHGRLRAGARARPARDERHPLVRARRRLRAGAGGFLTTGGSLANFSAVVTARHERLPEDFLKGTLYVSDQGHHCIRKAALLAGFPAANVREIPTDSAFRMRLDALAARVAEDRAAGFTPFLVVASAGTTNTGAVDDLDALADFAASEDLWLHTDAAYGGFFALTERGRAAIAASSAPTRSSSTRTRASSCPTAPGASS